MDRDIEILYEVHDHPLDPCPECQADKHGNCQGDTWDNVKDVPAVCPCWEAGHKP